MACECLSDMNAALVEHNTKLPETLIFGRSGQPGYVTPTLHTERIQNLRNGKKATAVIPAFCPFCGVRYVAEQEKANG